MSQCRIPEVARRGTAYLYGSCKKYVDLCCPRGLETRSAFLSSWKLPHSCARSMLVQRPLNRTKRSDNIVCGKLATRTELMRLDPADEGSLHPRIREEPCTAPKPRFHSERMSFGPLSWLIP